MIEINWIVVADAHRARVFHFAQDKKLHLLVEYQAADVHKKSSALMSNYAGELGAGHRVESSDPKLHDANLFANALAKKLEHDRTQHSFTKLTLVAPPAFLGLLKEHLAKEVHKLMQTIEKDYTQTPVDKLLEHLHEHLAIT